ncbi:MAG: leucyl aminopeptidase [Gammaproteobacteria bacterium]|nr:MAG: leucyl aminopeptidase [Gammaproteobacteria bacterium]
MKIQSSVHDITTAQTDCLVVAIHATKADEKVAITGALTTLDKASDGFFANHAKRLPKKAGTVRTFYKIAGIKACAVSVIAIDPTQKGLGEAGVAMTKYLREHEVERASLVFPQLPDSELDSRTVARLLAQNLSNSDYDFDDFKSDAKDKPAIHVDILLDHADAEVDTGIEQGVAIAKGMKTLRDLGNLPGNVCTPKYLGKTAKKLAAKYDSLSVEVLKEKDIKALKMGSLLSVSKGSIEPPRLIKLQHKGSDDAPIIFVGKGVTFDTGGISLKPGANMDEMKYDMCGAGAVMGLMKTVAMLNLPINVIGIIPSVENMPSDRASKPGDIVTSMSGKTIEILNTDAEGRLILCDALTYAQQFKPKAVIDMATLTGAVIIALGRHASGVMSNDDELANALVAAGERSNDRAWRLPAWDSYTEQLKSPFADLQNIGGREAGTITAGCFLQEFIEDVPWAHIDIAGTAWQTRKEGATGRPVPLLVEYLLSQVEK